MMVAFIFGFLSFLILLLFLYGLDLLLFLCRERKAFSSDTPVEETVLLLEKKQKKAKHPQKKNYYLYLICLAFFQLKKEEKARRLIPFLKKDVLLGVDPEKM